MAFLPSPLWGRGWLATGAFISRGETGEGVKTVAHDTNLTWGVHLGADPLTPTTRKSWGPLRLAVPPLPQGGEGKEILSWCCIHQRARLESRP